jgi:hypothetical protein
MKGAWIMNYIIAIIVGIILTLLSHIIYKISGANFYIAYISGAAVMLVYNAIIDWKKRKREMQ